MDSVLECASNFAQLVTVSNAVNRSCEGYLHGEADFYFEREFVYLAERGMQPEWPAVNTYLKATDLADVGYKTVLKE